MITRLLKKIIFAFIVIYGFDLLMKGLNVTVPINYYSVGLVTLLGFPGLIMLSLTFVFLL